jgi:kynurenine formamidase
MTTKHRIPTKEEVQSYLHDRTNWGRWGKKGSAGALNLITPKKTLAALRLATQGRTVSMSRPFNVNPSLENGRPAQHYMMVQDRPPGGGASMDFYGIFYHGQSTTHIDALCHVWDERGMWDGKDAKEVLKFDGAKYGSVDAWKEGIITRGVLLDVPRHRKKPYVTMEMPVHGWELEEIAAAEGVKLEAGDAVMVYSGRESYARDHGGLWGGGAQRPGLHASCLPFLRDNDVSILGWDMMDHQPNEYGLPWTVHGAIFAYGVALLDNALLEPLAKVCAEEKRWEFLVTINPLYVIGGTGSPVNPIAVF